MTQAKKHRTVRRWTFWGSLVAALGLLTLAAVLHYSIEDRSDAAIAQSKQTLRDWNGDGAKALDERLVKIETIVMILADDLEAGRIDLEPTVVPGLPLRCAPDANRFARLMSEVLCHRANKVPSLNGLGVIFLDPSLEDYRPYATRANGPLTLDSLKKRDFETTDWVRSALDTGPDWTDVRLGATSQTLLALYSQAFELRDGTVGVVLASYALDQLADDLRWSGPGLPGYSLVLDENKRLISHPHSQRVSDSVEKGKDVTGVAGELIERGLEMTDFPADVITLDDDLTKKSALVTTTQIEATAWTLATVVIEDDLDAADGHHKRVIWRGGAMILGVTFVGLALIATRPGHLRVLWGGAIWIAIGALIATVWVWNVATDLPYERPALNLSDSATSPTKDDPELESDSSDPEEAPNDLSVGIFVQSLEFTGANSVSVSGIVWQELRDVGIDVKARGFTLPEADEITMEEQYRSLSKDGVVRIGWSFTANLRQSFNYARYPFDNEAVWLRMWPADYALDQRIVPDVTSYATLAPSAKPGVEKEIIVEGWDVVGTSFSYGKVDLSTQFTPESDVGEVASDLYFNVHLRRSFLDVLLSKLVVLSVVTVLLFGVLLVTHFGMKNQEQSGFSTLSVLGYSASLFFVTIISHDSLRRELRAQEVIYLEYFYFITYATILLVSLNAIIVGWSKNKVLLWENNLLPALTFWPVQGIAVMGITYASFGGG